MAYQLGQWKTAVLGHEKAIAWLEKTPKTVRSTPLIAVLMGDCYSALDRWLDLESLARGSNWRQLEALRLAFLAQAQAKQNNSEKSQTTWNLALDAARKQSRYSTAAASGDGKSR